MRRSAPFIALIAVVTALYPLAVYYGLFFFQPGTLALGLLGLLLLRFIFLIEKKSASQAIPLLLIGALCLSVAWFQSEALLRYYPVLMNMCFAGLFWFSLKSEKTLIERFASIITKEHSEHALRYMRGLTKAWAGLLLINSLIALYTAYCATFEFWALYNGVIAYLVFAAFTLCELVYRHRYKKRHEG